VYETIITLRPYFFSLREINETLSLDIKVPAIWKYERFFSDIEPVKFKTQDKNEKFHLVSLLSTPSQDGFDHVIRVAKNIIKFNVEEEEKQKLFEQKINELKSLFQNESLDKLKEINFLEPNGQDNTVAGVVKQGDYKEPKLT
jgi:hypothetical protein